MKIQVLISTYQDSIRKIPKVISSIPSDVDILVVHQTEEAANYDYESLFSGRSVIVIPSATCGLAKSRNIAVANATGDILIPTDDDVRFLRDSFAKIVHEFVENPAAQLISFQMISSDGKTYMPYKPHSFKHRLSTIRKVSSIEIAVRRDAFIEHNLRWDENFGINSRYPGGLEQAFLKNALDLKLNAFYCPIPIVEHTPDSTGFKHTPESAFYRGAVYAKLFGLSSWAILPAFAVKNAWRAGSFGGAFQYTRNLFAGARDYLSRSKNSK